MRERGTFPNMHSHSHKLIGVKIEDEKKVSINTYVQTDKAIERASRSDV